MSKKIFVGNLDWGIRSEDLQALFAPHGAIEEAVVITDRMSGRSKGFGFVTMSNAEADAAIEALDGHEYKGRKLVVNEARPREDRGDRF